MLSKRIKRTLCKLYRESIPSSTLYVLAATSSGKVEVNIREWLPHWNEWEFIRVTRSNSLQDIRAILRIGDVMRSYEQDGHIEKTSR